MDIGAALVVAAMATTTAVMATPVMTSPIRGALLGTPCANMLVVCMHMYDGSIYVDIRSLCRNPCR